MRRNKSIRLRVSDAERSFIKVRAEKYGKKVAPYIREVAQTPTITKIDYPEIKAHTRFVAERVAMINKIIHTISVTENYSLREIERIKGYIEEIRYSQDQLLETARKNGFTTKTEQNE